ncbi:hypothetical protein MKJ04_21295 [Pontibacter sp. E15-1]|nr:hypothetical protein [Pontibacter sp. E15-1]MCJ8167391.1 hypothetical protein [Pontibacter sp. E15-1]
MSRSSLSPLVVLGVSILVVGIVTCVYMSECFDNVTLDIDTSDEDSEDYT